MASVLVTGSTQGLGRLSAQWLLDCGHMVILHARSTDRMDAVDTLLAQGCTAVVGDFGDQSAIHQVADQVNALGPLDAVIHNAGVVDGPDLVTINVVAPYILTALINRPSRLIYLSSNDHFGGVGDIDRLGLDGGVPTATYADTKWFLTAFAMAMSIRWPDTVCSAVDPGWVPTRMGGVYAPDDLSQGAVTQAWLAVGQESTAYMSGHYWYHMRPRQPHHGTQDHGCHEALIRSLASFTGVSLP
ncbi:SDR family NAD(P)-dependent oxidoreductase [Stomatohabitans albus]|uniref:SDR family NAD(P)-dependent oxidoreductase n=1 Tax=Stomatohabitans albus TaxID=3110766 RepID=UPI00300C9187